MRDPKHKITFHTRGPEPAADAAAGIENTNSSPEPLTRSEQERGIRNYLRHASWNGLGIYLLNVNIISLLAISFGASNLQLGYISSAFHLSGFILIFLPRLLQGAGIRNVFARAWYIRGVICLFYASLFFLSGQAAVVVIMLIYTVFAMMRSVGVPMHHPLQKELVQPSEEGSFVSRFSFRLSISQLASQIFSFTFLSLQIFAGSTGLILIPIIGAGCNTAAAYYVSKIPSRERVEYHPGRNVLQIFRETMAHPERRQVLLLHWLGMSSLIVFTFGIAFLRREVEMPTSMTFLYSISTAGAAILASFILRPFVDRVGSRPLLAIAYGSISLGAIAWIFIPNSLAWPLYYLLGSFSYFFLRLEILLVSRLIIRNLPEDSRISFTSMMHFSSAVIALLIGLLAGQLAEIGLTLSQLTDIVPHQYSLTFIFGFIIALAGLLTAYKLRDSGSLGIRQTASIFRSVRSIREFLADGAV